uniref:Uncharacterized protein n=1 Tax=Avena sativa TaxID=4498 RepID=A0ACD5XH10_AVESA
MITAISWVPKGAARTVPIEAEPPTQEEIEEAKKSIALGRAGGDADDAEGDEDYGDMELEDDEDEVDEVAQARAAAKALGKSGSAAVGDISDGMAELNMDAYDEEEDELEVFSTGLGDLYYKDNKDDPYIIKKNDDDDEDDDDDDSEIEDMIIKPTDIVLVCAHNEDEFNSLQVSIVEEQEDGDPNMFVHHEVPISDFPLCTAWMDFNRKNGDEKGNFIAVGTMDPIIEIWNLDIVQSVAWRSPEVLLSGSFDRFVIMSDMRDNGQTYHKWSVEADVESLVCDPHNEHSFLVSLDNGMVQAFDTRTASSNSNRGQPTFTLHAHNKAASAISFCPSKPNFIATCGTDKMVKLWDISNNQPSCVASLNAKLGAVFTVTFCNDSPFLLACGGSKGKLKIWNTLSEPAVASKFGK